MLERATGALVIDIDHQSYPDDPAKRNVYVERLKDLFKNVFDQYCRKLEAMSDYK